MFEGRVTGQFLELHREMMAAFVNRKQGYLPSVGSACTTAEQSMQSLWMPAMGALGDYYTNDDGSVWNPQNQSNFVFDTLPGFDEPLP